MAAYQFRLPDVGEGVAEAEITVWHVKVGDVVREDQSLLDVMTDKATVDMTSPVDGTVTAIHGEVGTMMPVGSVLVELALAGDAEAAGQPPVAEPARTDIEAVPPPAKPASPPPAAAPSASALPPVAAPSTRRRAIEAGVELASIPASGPAGRVTSHDLDAFLARQETAGVAAVGSDDGITALRIVGLRRRIAEKMQEAKRRIPHITYVEEIDVTALEALRHEINAGRGAERPKLTLLPFLIRALVRVLPAYPQINARYDDDAGLLHQHAAVHVGIATQTEAGLMVPVIRHADTQDLWTLATGIARLSTAARDGTAPREALSGSTITISSLGPLGGIVTTPVINHPEVAILAPNRIVERPVMNGAFVSMRKVMNLSAAFDHRIVDGHDAALFVHALKRMIEHPALIFMEGV